MTFEATSSINNEPVEFYEFIAGNVASRFVNAPVDMVGPAGNLYTAAPITRSEPIESKDKSSGDINITAPNTLAFFVNFRHIPPSSLPVCTIFKQLQNDVDSEFVVYWKGSIASFKNSERTTTLACQPITRIFNKQIPRAVFSGLCQHVHYDGGCLLSKTSFQFETQITTIDPDGVTLTFTGARARAAALVPTLTSAELDLFWAGGFIETALANESRGIYEGNVGGDPEVMRILVPFQTLNAGDNITLFGGCDHSAPTCHKKFNNLVRFGGYPFVPGESNNPFTTQIDGGIALPAAPGGSVSRFR